MKQIADFAIKMITEIEIYRVTIMHFLYSDNSF
jgi:hypothetical protein